MSLENIGECFELVMYDTLHNIAQYSVEMCKFKWAYDSHMFHAFFMPIMFENFSALK